MSARIVPFTALCFVLLTLACAVIATAQTPLAPQDGQLQPAAAPQQTQPQPIQQPQAVMQAQLPGQAYPQPAPQAPFTLSPEEQGVVDRVLVDWQAMSANVKTFQSDFTRWDYDGVFGDATTPKKIVNGVLRYSAPDKGYYDLEDKSEKWICTGDAIFEFKTDQKQVREYPLPPEMRGKAISEGPLPFVFGVEAEKMKARYWLRITTPPQNQGTQVWIEAFPKLAKDAANFTKVDIILTFLVQDGKVVKLEPFGMNMVLPNGKDRTAYVFRNMETNGVLANFKEFIGWFVRPATPLGWQHHVIDENAPPANPQNPQGGQPGANIGSAPQPTVPR